MNKFLGLGMAVLVGSLVLTGCGEKKASPQAEAQATQTEKVPDVAVYGKGPTAKICPVSGDKIGGDMGKPYVYTMENGKKITLCCPVCKAAVKNDPAKYAAFFY